MADVLCCAFSTEVVETDTSGASVTDDEGKYYLLTPEVSQKTCIQQFAQNLCVVF